MKIYFPLLNNVLPTWAITLIIVGGVVVLAAVFLLFFFLFRGKKNKGVDNSAWILALGGSENIKTVSANGSRLTIALVDNEKIDREALTKLGVKSTLTMSAKMILVLAFKAEVVAESIQNSLKG